MDIQQFRVVLRAKNFDLTSEFYGQVIALPRLTSWDNDLGRGALFQAGTGVIELLGQPREAPDEPDEEFTYQGPKHKLTITLVVPSAEGAYEELIFRNRNIPGGLKEAPDGVLEFETHDPDGVKVVFREVSREGS